MRDGLHSNGGSLSFGFNGGITQRRTISSACFANQTNKKMNMLVITTLEHQINVHQILFQFWILAHLSTRLFRTTYVLDR